MSTWMNYKGVVIPDTLPRKAAGRKLRSDLMAVVDAQPKTIVVADNVARYALTSADVRIGDFVKQTSSHTVWQPLDTSDLTLDANWVEVSPVFSPILVRNFFQGSPNAWWGGSSIRNSNKGGCWWDMSGGVYLSPNDPSFTDVYALTRHDVPIVDGDAWNSGAATIAYHNHAAHQPNWNQALFNGLGGCENPGNGYLGTLTKPICE